jgi:hypothetical protein
MQCKASSGCSGSGVNQCLTKKSHQPRTPLAPPGQGGASARTLAPIYDWFTEGFDTLDLKEAKALLEELSQ